MRLDVKERSGSVCWLKRPDGLQKEDLETAHV